MSAVFASSAWILQQQILEENANKCKKELGGESFRAPATVLDKTSGQVNVVVDYRGDGTESTVLPQTRVDDLSTFPDPKIVAYRIIQAFRQPDVYGEWFYKQLHPDARLQYGGRIQVQWLMSGQTSVMRWIGAATDFRIKMFFMDYRSVEAEMQVEIRLPNGGSMVYGFDFERNNALDTYWQEAPKSDWRIRRMYPIVTQ